jgi:hypothetical protein
MEECAHDRANHVLEESAAAYPEDPFFGIAPPHCLKYGSDPVFDLRRGRAEGREIMDSLKVSAGRIHRRRIHRIGKCIHISAVKRADDVLAPHTVLVGLRDS